MADTYPLFRDRNNVKKTIKTFEKSNGKTLKEFTHKEILLLTYNDLKERIYETNEKLEKHIKWGEELKPKIDGKVAKNTALIAQITNDLKHIADALPEKGFCEKITNNLELSKEVTLKDKVDLLWHDRRWIKYVLATAITLISIFGTGNLLINIFG